MDWQYHPQEIVWRPSRNSLPDAPARFAMALQAHRPTGWVRHGAAFSATLDGDPGKSRSNGLHAAMVANGGQTALSFHGHPDLALQRGLLRSCDIVVAEGRVGSSAPWIVELDASGRGLEEIPPEDLHRVCALVGPRAPVAELPPGGIPRFSPDGIDDFAELAEHVLDLLETRGRERPLVGLLLAGTGDDVQALASARLALSGICQRVGMVAPPGATVPRECETVASNHPGWGDSGRILSAFEAFPGSSLVVLDTRPGNAARLERLLSERDVLAAATAFRDRDTHMPELGASLWEPRAKESLLAMLGAGVVCPRRTLVQARTHLIDP